MVARPHVEVLAVGAPDVRRLAGRDRGAVAAARATVAVHPRCDRHRKPARHATLYFDPVPDLQAVALGGALADLGDPAEDLVPERQRHGMR